MQLEFPHIDAMPAEARQMVDAFIAALPDEIRLTSVIVALGYLTAVFDRVASGPKGIAPPGALIEEVAAGARIIASPKD